MLAIKRRLPTRLLFVVLTVAVFLLLVLVFRFKPTAFNYELPAHSANAESAAEEKTAWNPPPRREYPRRANMSACPPLFGRVGVFVAVSSDHNARLYKIAQASLQCYLKSTNYAYFYVDLDKDERTLGLCNQTNSRRFLLEWAATNDQQFDGFTGYDNGALQLQVLKAALPHAVAEIKACDAIYRRGKTVQQYYNYVTCCKLQLGATRVFPGRLRVYRRAHGWARDSSLTGNHWSPADFMIHAWKASELNSTWFDANVFEEIPDPAECGRGLSGWRWRPEKRATVAENRERMAAFEEGVAQGYPKEGRDLPHLVEPDVRECYPDCDRLT
ncbi:hypothetical protein M3Y99_00297200 [Aphelenchoides fujianensis]|nr:hypothetical protein M3Y99_00295900 [Aphelenchoides fujianensis]KAI6241768.1 hypothetical protein M3Y99_00297200 [Aphelenchoides fujianensis]